MLHAASRNNKIQTRTAVRNDPPERGDDGRASKIMFAFRRVQNSRRASHNLRPRVVSYSRTASSKSSRPTCFSPGYESSRRRSCIPTAKYPPSKTRTTADVATTNTWQGLTSSPHRTRNGSYWSSGARTLFLRYGRACTRSGSRSGSPAGHPREQGRHGCRSGEGAGSIDPEARLGRRQCVCLPAYGCGAHARHRYAEEVWLLEVQGCDAKR